MENDLAYNDPAAASIIRLDNICLTQDDWVVGSSEPHRSISDIVLYPNPFSNEFTISFDIPIVQNLSLAITDVHSRVLHAENIPAGIGHWDIRPNDLPNGFYFVRLMYEGGGAVWRKVVKD